MRHFIFLSLVVFLIGVSQLEAGLKFDGRAGEVRIPDLRYRGETPLTIEIVLTPDVSRNRQSRVFSNINSVDDKAEGLSLSVFQGYWMVAIQTERGLRRLISDYPYVNGARVHLAVVIEGKRVEFFVNGRENDSRLVLTHPFVPSTENFYLGCQRNDEGRIGYRFFGEIDAVRVSSVARYKRDFTPDQNLTTDQETMLLYDFREKPGATCRDLSGLGFDGQMTDTTWIKSSSQTSYDDVSDLERVVGIHEVKRKIKEGIPLKPTFFEFTSEKTVLEAGKKVGSWKLGESQTVELTGEGLSDVVLEFDSDSEMKGVQNRDGRQIEWELQRIRIEMVWNHLQLAGNRIAGSREYEFYSNGKFGTYDHQWQWEQKGSYLRLQWEPGNVSQLKLSRDKQTYSGVSGKGVKLGGVRLD